MKEFGVALTVDRVKYIKDKQIFIIFIKNKVTDKEVELMMLEDGWVSDN